MYIELNDYIIVIEDSVIKEINRYKQFSNQNESGGILLGKKLKGKKELHIVDISKPNKHDSSSRFYFVRNAKAAQKIIKKKWKKSNGYVNYIGEWHTHREAKPIPSKVDIDSYKRISIEKSSLYGETINLIIGNSAYFYINIVYEGAIILERLVTKEDE